MIKIDEYATTKKISHDKMKEIFLADSATPRAFNEAWDQDELPIERQESKVKNPLRKGPKLTICASKQP